MKKILSILLILLFSCDPFCSSDKLSEEDQLKLKRIDENYPEYKISSDECLPLGYFNITILNNTNEIDTIKLYRIFDEVQNSKLTPQRMQIYSPENNFRFVLYKVGDQHLILLPNDL